jgi:hypothetical protein
MNRLLKKLLCINFRQYAMRRRTPNKFLKEFSHESFVKLNPEE